MEVEPKIFISYAHKSERAVNFVDKLKIVLESINVTHKLNKTRINRRFKILFDENILLGEAWGHNVDDAIDKSFAVLVCVTREALASHYVTYEWSRALALGKLVLPVVLEELDDKKEVGNSVVTFHPKLQEIQWAYLNDVSTHRQAIENLIEFLENKYDEHNGSDQQHTFQQIPR